jgi:phosphoribosylanthranilate isomerase
LACLPAGLAYRRAVRVRVKICGITNVEDAVASVDAGADALGFMFFPESKRHLALDRAAEIIRRLPPFISKVGVFVNPAAEAVHEAIEQTGIDTLQFHGAESPEFCAAFNKVKVVKAFRVRGASVLEECLKFPDYAWLLDSHVSGAQGGTGVTFDWNVAAAATKLSRMIILAGGLKPETVAEAVQRVHPFAVDVSSGVESAPGRKDHQKIRQFIEAARTALS